MINSFVKSVAFIASILLIHTALAQDPHTAPLDPASSKQPRETAVIGYYAGRNTAIDSFATEKLTHIIFSFCHLKGNLMSVNNANDSAIIRHLVSLKSKNPHLKVILSLGGWGGCKTCPQVFAT